MNIYVLFIISLVIFFFGLYSSKNMGNFNSFYAPPNIETSDNYQYKLDKNYFKNDWQVKAVNWNLVRKWIKSNPIQGRIWLQAVSQQKPIIVYIYADWCRACKSTSPILDRLAYEYESKYTYIKVNVDCEKNEPLLKAFNPEGYPGIYLINNKTNKVYDMPNYRDDRENLFRNDMNDFLEGT